MTNNIPRPRGYDESVREKVAEVKSNIDAILSSILAEEPKYMYRCSIRWGLVQRELHQEIDQILSIIRAEVEGMKKEGILARQNDTAFEVTRIAEHNRGVRDWNAFADELLRKLE